VLLVPVGAAAGGSDRLRLPPQLVILLVVLVGAGGFSLPLLLVPNYH
jgi:hypothetical protein